MVFDLPLVEEKTKPHQVTSLHLLCGLAFTGTGAIIFAYNYDITWWGFALLAAGLLLLGVTILKNQWVTSKKMNPVVRILEFCISLSVDVLSFSQHWKFPEVIFSMLGFAVAFALFWERASGGKLFVHVDGTGIKLPITSRKRFLPWTEVDQVLLRFGTLSIECTQNRLFQWNILEPKNDYTPLEHYCTEQIEINKVKRIKDDW